MKNNEMIQLDTLYAGKVKKPKERLIFRPSAYGIIINDGKILLVKMKGNGKYFFPGGGIEKGELMEDGLRREIKEETGIDVEIIKFFCFKESFFNNNKLDEAYHGLCFFYICKAINFNLSDSGTDEYEESEKPCWIFFDSLKKEDFHAFAWEIFEEIKKTFCSTQS